MKKPAKVPTTLTIPINIGVLSTVEQVVAFSEGHKIGCLDFHRPISTPPTSNPYKLVDSLVPDSPEYTGCYDAWSNGWRVGLHSESQVR